MSNISAKVIADSVSAVNGKRITTYELEFPRFILPEFNTHRMISKNAASSRAIPVKAMLENIRANPAMPSHWGKNQSGMQANEELDWQTQAGAKEQWRIAMLNSIYCAESLNLIGVHKQVANRLTEPFQMIKVVATATEWDNFFWLRKHADAQPEIRILAEKMWEAREASTPEILQSGEWHTPYVDHWRHRDGNLLYTIDSGERKIDSGEEVVVWKWLTLEEALKVSSSMCAQVSYRKADDTLEKALMVYDRLVESKPVHASPFEHQATPMDDPRNWGDAYERITMADWPDGVTGQHYNLGYTSGNFAGWIQHRQLIADNTCWNFVDNN